MNRFRAEGALSFLLLFLVVVPRPAAAQWAANGNPICVFSGEQSYPAATPDGAGGAIEVWQDTRSGASDLYIQRITSTGALASGWPANGLALCTAVGDQKSAVIAGDGSGGAFIAWEDYRAGGANADVYLQHITSTGALASGWPANGLALCTEAGAQGYPAIIVASGYAMVAWQDDRSGLSSDIYAQRVSPAGVAQWTSAGIEVSIASGNQMFPWIVGDGAGGGIVTWQDGRGGDWDIYAQRLNSSGAGLWTTDGIALCGAASDQLTPRLVADGAGGAVLVWDDYRSMNADVYAQRVNASGVALWPADGVALCTDAAEQYSAAPIADGAGGAIVPWQDYRGGSGDLYAQRVTATGAIASGWPANGVAVCTAAGDQVDPVAAPDGLGGMILIWGDARAGVSAVDIYAQRITASGLVASGWPTNGTVVCNAVNNQLRPAVASDGSGAAIVSWYDERSGLADVYAKRLTASGTVDVPDVLAGELGLAAPAPNPMGAGTSLSFRIATPTPARLEVFDIAGRAVKVLIDETWLEPGLYRVPWDGRDASGAPAPAGLYLVSLRTTVSEVRKLTLLR